MGDEDGPLIIPLLKIIEPQENNKSLISNSPCYSTNNQSGFGTIFIACRVNWVYATEPGKCMDMKLSGMLKRSSNENPFIDENEISSL